MSFNLPPPLTAAEKAERLRLRAIDGAAARAEYDASVASEDEKIARLRTLRLERDRIEAEAAAAAAPKTTRKAPARKRKPVSAA